MPFVFSMFVHTWLIFVNGADVGFPLRTAGKQQAVKSCVYVH